MDVSFFVVIAISTTIALSHLVHNHFLTYSSHGVGTTFVRLEL